MSERKVLNKYYPPDFDVTKLPKLRLSRDRQFVIRIMAPFSMRCKTCGDYIYKGRKFNARQETVNNETYLGLRIFRFYIRCPKCLSEITFKTDPENTDYTMEEGAIRNFEAFRLAKKQEQKAKEEKEEEELNNPMKALENRTMESRQEMDMLEKLEELKDLNARHAAVDHDQLIRDHILVDEEARKRKQEEADEALIKSVFGNNDDGYVKRIDDFAADDDDDDDCQIRNVNKPPAIEDEGNRKRIATDLLMEEEESTKPKKKPKQEHGVVAFSKIKAASIVRLKKQASNKPTPSSRAESTAARPGELSNKKAESTTVRQEDVSNLKAESTVVRPGIKKEESCAVSTNATVVSLDSETKKTDCSKANEPSTSLLLLGNYDSSSNSEDSN
eukprot:Seg2713.5 transcript_id=Seg2713.5/GoldUCD/mRNA.D3Y31 product="YJU2 splicing factor" protein_id=Seg2713.5/GoldUCD/D3Y31